MRLADFIESNVEPILAEWVEFAESSGAAGRAMDVSGLRDHASQMLTEIVSDLRTPQTDAQRTEKSKGKGDSSSEPDAVRVLVPTIFGRATVTIPLVVGR